MQRSGVSFPIEFHECAGCSHLGIVRFDRQRAIQRQSFFCIAPETRVTQRNLLQHVNVARIEISRTLEISNGLFPAPLTSLDVTLQFEYSRVIGQVCWAISSSASAP